jgi:hypothetical protein
VGYAVRALGIRESGMVGNGARSSEEMRIDRGIN